MWPIFVSVLSRVVLMKRKTCSTFFRIYINNGRYSDELRTDVAGHSIRLCEIIGFVANYEGNGNTLQTSGPCRI